jgi:hypothetical protein
LIVNDIQRQFLDRAKAEAVKANHPFPCMAAAEAALESNWGNSQLAREANNLFGMKMHEHNVYGKITLPAREWSPGSGWKEIPGTPWEKYPDWRACFCDRLVTLERLANAYPHYAAALKAIDAKSYIVSVSESWSTDPGWPCSCGEGFVTEEAAKIHANGSGATHGRGHIIGAAVPGLGRAVKALHIYQDYKAVPAAAIPGAAVPSVQKV